MRCYLNHNMYMISITGASSSGKTTIANKIAEEVGKEKCYVLSQDNFYKSIPEGVDSATYNFDDPKAIDFDALIKVLTALKNRTYAEIPNYCFKTHKRTGYSMIDFTGSVIILEGILTMCSISIIEMMDMKIFVDTDLDVCLMRRIRRDIGERGRDLNSVLQQYKQFVKPAYHKYISNFKHKCDLIIPNHIENQCAFDVLKSYVVNKTSKVN